MQRLYWEQGDKFMPERWLQEPNPDAYDPARHHPSKVLAPGDNSAPLPTPPASPGAGTEQGGTNRGPKRFLPFLEGPRDCVGQSLAKVTVPATVAVLLSRFSFTMQEGFDHDGIDCNGVSLRPKQGLPMHCIPRTCPAKAERN